MNETTFLTYQKFSSEAEIAELTEVLSANNIEFLVEDTSSGFDPSFANNEFNNEFRIKLKKQDFELADKLLLGISAKQLDEVDKDYYLFEFSDDELIEVITKNDEWGKFDYLLAQKILKDRGMAVNEKLLESLRKQRIEELSKPEESQRAWIIVGYAFALLGGLIGVFIGWHLTTHKRTLPNGDRLYAYSAEDRKHGNSIMILGIIFFVLWTFIRIMTRE